METLDVLKTSLLDLHKEVARHGIRLIVGGGYGLYLKQQLLQSQHIETLLDVEIWPEARATNDLDVFLTAEVATDSTSMKVIRSALDKLGYLEIESAKFYQFVKPLRVGQQVKLDLLAGPLGQYEERAKVDVRRVRPRRSVNLHARRVDEALCIEESCTEIEVDGCLSSGEAHEATVCVPQSFSYLLMKLWAFRDRKDDADKDMGRHHALDVLCIVAMMTRQEYEETHHLFSMYAEQEPARAARRTVRECFADDNAIGMIRMREHQLFRRDIDIAAFLRNLHALLKR
ncbi:MAG: hypothetical protein JXA69_00805 [Phycisphaerae bacterium]|nr:hypothetical protein [Phycisphaerae bacterium]